MARKLNRSYTCIEEIKILHIYYVQNYIQEIKTRWLLHISVHERKLLATAIFISWHIYTYIGEDINLLVINLQNHLFWLSTAHIYIYKFNLSSDGVYLSWPVPVLGGSLCNEQFHLTNCTTPFRGLRERGRGDLVPAPTRTLGFP